MAASDKSVDDSLYPIAVLIDELKNEDVQVNRISPFPLNPFDRPNPLLLSLFVFYLFLCCQSQE